MYAVVDLETTGLSVGHHHRVCEIAIVRLDRHGHVTDEWSSLVNPGRDLRTQAVQGISAVDQVGSGRGERHGFCRSLG